MVEKPVEKAEKSSALPRSPDLMSAEDSALLVVDAQVKLLEIIPQRARIVWNIRRLLDAANALRVPVAATEQYPDRLSPTVPETSSVCCASMTAIIASRRRRARSIRHSLASSVAARGILAG